MRKFILQCLLFFLVVLVLFIGIGLLPKRGSSNDYLYGIALKHHLIDSIRQPKIILAGGSNVAFGFDSREIADSLQMPVVNLSIHAGLGLDYMLNELEHVVKPDDIVFLSPEYFLSPAGEWGLKKMATDFYPGAKAYFSWDPVAQLEYYLKYNQRTLRAYLSGDIRQDKDSIYCRDDFDPATGDVIIHLNKAAHKELKEIGTVPYRSWDDGIAAINKFGDFAKVHHVRVFYLFPTCTATMFQLNEQAFDHLASDVRKKLKIAILNKPDDFVYSDSLYFDTGYHLTKSGRQLRTEKMISVVRSTPALASLGRKTAISALTAPGK